MSSMKEVYLNQMLPMDGQQADPPETAEAETETKPVVITTHPNQQPLFTADRTVFDAAFSEWFDGGAK